MEVTLVCSCGEEFKEADAESERARAHILERHANDETITFTVTFPVAKLLEEGGL